eukprot:640661-Pelagomonas_calceolata.AAC.8
MTVTGHEQCASVNMLLAVLVAAAGNPHTRPAHAPVLLECSRDTRCLQGLHRSCICVSAKGSIKQKAVKPGSQSLHKHQQEENDSSIHSLIASKCCCAGGIPKGKTIGSSLLKVSRVGGHERCCQGEPKRQGTRMVVAFEDDGCWKCARSSKYAGG